MMKQNLFQISFRRYHAKKDPGAFDHMVPGLGKSIDSAMGKP
jgi:hypothetical protein